MITSIKSKFLLITASFLFGITFLQGCDDGCNMLCNTPPEPFRFELIDRASGENVFANGTYDPDQIQVLDVKDSSNVEFSFVEEGESELIIINSIGWKTEQVNFSVNIADEEIFTLHVDAKRVDSDCCAHTEFDEILIENTGYKLDTLNEAYTIFVE